MGSEGWATVPVSNLCHIYLGGTPRRSEPSYWGGSIKWATAADVANCHTRYLEKVEQTITERGVAESAAKVLPKNTIVITARGTVGSLCMLPEPMAFNQTCYGLVAREGVIHSYLYYALKAAVSQINSLSYGTVFDTITMKSFDSLSVPVLPIEEQQAIACILGALDDKIELNRRMNQTLEAMARAIFKSWFVDFDPVRAKAAGRQPPGLVPHISELFPDSFVNSELGEIPRGWKVAKLTDEFNLTMGQSPPGSTYNESGHGYPFFQGTKDFGHRFPAKRVYCTAPTRFAHAGDTLVSVRAPVGNLNMASEKCCIGRGLAALRHRSNSRSYTYYAMHFAKGLFLVFDAEGTVFGSISKKDLESISFVAPPTEVVSMFELIVFPIDEQISTNEREIKVLAALRDALLPKLISGELRVPDAERIIGRCV